MAQATMQKPSTDAAVEQSTRLLTALSEGYTGNFTVQFWTGETWQPGTGESSFTIVLKQPGALRAMFWPFNKLGLGEAYIFDDFDIAGDILVFVVWLRHIVRLADTRGLFAKLNLLRALKKLPNQVNPRDGSLAGKPTEGDHSLAKDKEAISYTYDLPAPFYELFLDKNMQYTCSYFANPTESIDESQSRKLDYICKKLRLKPNEKYADFGCGWGGLIIHAAKQYGVHATGVTLSGAQADYAERKVAEAGLADRVKIVRCDYRHFERAGEFDKASSVGMSEHIGVKNLPVFLGAIHKCLKPGGAYLHHAIMLRPNTPYPRWTAFARKYVFPNGELQTVIQTQAAAAQIGFEIRDIENLREHYVLTLEAWVRKLESNRDDVLKLVGDVSYRIFRLYMAGATMGFRSGVYGLNQCLFIKQDGDSAGLPLSRADWYG